MSEFVKDTNVPTNDCISRQAALMGYQGVCEGISCDECPFSIKEGTFTDCRLERFIHNLPSAQSDIDSHVVPAKFVIGDDGFVRCSACNKTIRYPLVSFRDIEYCPRCGTKIKMEEGNETD